MSDVNTMSDGALNELLTNLTIAQLRHVHEMTVPDQEYAGISAALHSDDGYDYLRGALALGHDLMNLQYDNDLQGFKNLLDPEHEDFAFGSYASDGICAAVYAAFPPNWEERFDKQ